jgi:UDP-4-amino-4,6-dideoxy-N-acetyl-beta-L-altrosamine N-acetyltransferase
MLSYGDFELKDFDEAHLGIVLNWRNSEHIRNMMYSDHVISLEEHTAWYKKAKESQSTILKIFFYKDSPVGVVNFTQIDKQSNKCYWGFYIGEKDVPKGSGSVMGYLALSLIFKNYGIRKLCSEIMDYNIQSIHYHKKLGFTEEGRFVKHVLKNGRYVDVIAMSLFKDDWICIKKKYEIKYSIGYDNNI